MRLITFVFCALMSFSANAVFAEEQLPAEDYISSCKKDIEFLRSSLEKNSATYVNKSDFAFHEWYDKGYQDTLKLIEAIGDKDDCYYAMKYYVNGFRKSHISMRAYIPLPVEQYPGFLSVVKDDDHVVIYKHDGIEYLRDLQVGDKITHINDMSVDTYYQDYVLPFYANDNSGLTFEVASLYVLILDGNRFKPLVHNVTVERGGKSMRFDVKYTELKGGALVAAKKVSQPTASDTFKIETVSNGIWIRIPSFFPNTKESVYYTGMLSSLKNKLAKEDYILFDLRGNKGGASKWSRPIIRNLWGDEFIKSLGAKHVYNQDAEKLLRVSKDNFAEFKKIYGEEEIKSYADALKKGKDFILKKWSIFRDEDNLYTNNDSKPFKAKVYVLTDRFCRSTCWNFVNELKQMPNVVHIGEATTIRDGYSFGKQVRSPSENFDFFYPTQITIQPKFRIGQSLVPSEIYHGDFRDEAELTNWILSIAEKDAE
jgi:hypothetical protein